MKPPESMTLEELLADATWLRRVAAALVRDPADADDVAQRTVVAAIERPPSHRHEPRRWLSTVARNIARMMGRAGTRRLRREALFERDAVPSPEALLERAELQRQLATVLAELREPYRTTVLLCYFEDLSPSEIARRLGVPAGTVRWRLKRGLEQLRAGLDQHHGKRRASWLVPMAALGRTGKSHLVPLSIKGIALMTKKILIAATAALMLLLLIVARHSHGRAEQAAAAQADGAVVDKGNARASYAGATLHAPSNLVRVAGIVLAHDRPFGGALVSLSTVGSPTLRTRSDPQGAFAFDGVAAGRHALTAAAPGFRPALAVVDANESMPNHDEPRLELRLSECEASVYGTVRDSIGAGPIVGARISALLPTASFRTPLQADQLAGPIAETDENGRYEVCVAEGRNGVAVEAAAYGGEVFWMQVSRRARHDVTLAPEANVVGRVVRVEDDSPIAFARIEARAVTPGARQGLPATATSDAKGAFRLTGIAAGRWRVVADAEGLTLSQPVDVAIEPTRTSGEIVCRMEGAARLRGVVVEADRPVANAAIVATSTYQERRSSSAVTDSDGRFMLERVPRGPIRFDVAGYEVQEPRTLRVTLRPGEATVHVVSLGAIDGDVTRDGAPAPFSHVFARAPHGALNSDADARGHFRLGGLRPGSYIVSAWNGNVHASSPPVKLTLAAREQRKGVRLALTQTASIAGTVLDERKHPVADALVRLSADDGAGGLGETDDNGHFVVDELAAPRHFLAHVSVAESGAELPPAGEFPSIEIARSDQSVAGIELVVRINRATIAGHVVDTQGAPLADVQVSAAPMQPNEEVYLGNWREFPGATSDADGSFEIRNLADGDYGLHAVGGDGSEGVLKDVEAGSRAVSLVVRGAGGIDGTLVGFDQPPDVLVQRSGILYMVPLRAIVSGNQFTIRGLPPASYEVRTGGAEEGDDAIVQVQPGQIAQATLHSRGGTSLSGRVFDFQTGAPVPTMGCVSWFQNGAYRIVRPLPGVAWTDDAGHFDIPNMPAGAVGVTCWNDQGDYSDGIVALTTERGKHVEIDVPVVHRRAGPHADYGITLDFAFRVPIVAAVTPGGAADRAGARQGDVIVAVAGSDVTRLSISGVRALLEAHDPGEPTAISVRRGGQPVILRLGGTVASHE